MKEELIKRLPDDLIHKIVNMACERVEEEIEDEDEIEFFRKLNIGFDTPKFILRPS